MLHIYVFFEQQFFISFRLNLRAYVLFKIRKIEHFLLHNKYDYICLKKKKQNNHIWHIICFALPLHKVLKNRTKKRLLK